MTDFSSDVQLSSVNISKTLNSLSQQLDQVEKNVADDEENLFIIKTMIPLIRSKFHISTSDRCESVLGVIRWCLENGLVQQALTIFNENVPGMVISKELLSVDMNKYGAQINSFRTRYSSADEAAFLIALGNIFDCMRADSMNRSRELQNAIGLYAGRFKNIRTNEKSGFRKYSDWEWNIAAVFFDRQFLPDGIRVNTDAELLRRIFADCRFVHCTRNRVNHASSDDTYEKTVIDLFRDRSYPFSSYTSPDAFTPHNIIKDMTRALDNFGAALSLKGSPI